MNEETHTMRRKLFNNLCEFLYKDLHSLKSLISFPVGRWRILLIFLKGVLFTYLSFWLHILVYESPMLPGTFDDFIRLFKLVSKLFITVILSPIKAKQDIYIGLDPFLFHAIFIGFSLYGIQELLQKNNQGFRSFIHPHSSAEKCDDEGQGLMVGFLKKLLSLFLIFVVYSIFAGFFALPRSFNELISLFIMLPFCFLVTLFSPLFPKYIDPIRDFPTVYYVLSIRLILHWSRNIFRNIAKKRNLSEVPRKFTRNCKAFQEIPSSSRTVRRSVLLSFLKKLLFVYLVFWICILIRYPNMLPKSFSDFINLFLIGFLLFPLAFLFPFQPDSAFLVGDFPIFFYPVLAILICFWIWDFRRKLGGRRSHGQLAISGILEKVVIQMKTLFKVVRVLLSKIRAFLNPFLCYPKGRRKLLYGFLKRLLIFYLLFWVYAFIAYPEFVPRSLAHLPEISLIFSCLFPLILMLPLYPPYLSSISPALLIYYLILIGFLLYWIGSFIWKYWSDPYGFLSSFVGPEEEPEREKTLFEILDSISPEDEPCHRVPLPPSEKKKRLLRGFWKRLFYAYLAFLIYVLIFSPPSIPGSIGGLFSLLITIFVYFIMLLLVWPFEPEGFIFMSGPPMFCGLFYIIFLCLVSYWIWVFIRDGKFRTYLP